MTHRDLWRVPIFSLRPTILFASILNPKSLHRDIQLCRPSARSGIGAVRWSVDLAFKFFQPFATFIIVLFGVPFAAFRRRGGLVLGFGLSLLVCFV